MSTATRTIVTGERTPRRTAREAPGGWGLVRTALLALFAVYFLLPVVWLFIASSKSGGELYSTPALAFGSFRLLENLQALLAYDDGIFLRWAANSLLYAGGGALGGTIIAGMAGYYISKYRFRGNGALFMMVLGGVMVPTTALSLPLFLMFAQAGMTNTAWSVLLPSLVTPFAFYLSKIAADATVPDELIEAARLDGAGDFRIFFTLASRLMLPSFVAVFLVKFVGIWNNFLLPVLMLQDQDLYPLTLGLYVWNGQIPQTPELQTLVLVGSLMSIAPLIVCFLCLQRFWQRGIGAGAVKG
ncbi:carbohydrate ABC transporter permease [Microbacterium sp. NPDC055903]